MNQIVKTENSFADIMSIGKAFAESGMFTDIKSAAQAVVKITAGAEMGIPPFASMAGVHIIQGKPTIGAGLLASRVKASGKYTYKVIEMNDKVCTIEFFEGKESLGLSTFTIEDAKKAGTKNLDKFPRNMLFARAMSNGVKWYTPDLFASPVYVPEEMNMEPEVQDISHEVVDQDIEVTEEAINEAIKAIAICATEEELKDWKKITPTVLVKHPEVVSAAKARYNQIKGGVA